MTATSWVQSLYASKDFVSKQAKKLLPDLEKAAESARAALEEFLRQGTASAVPDHGEPKGGFSR